jgi:hypothetical protein
MSFWNGLLIGIVGTLLIVGIAEHFFGNGSPLLGRIPRWRHGVATRVEQRTLNGAGLLCLVLQTLITLFVALLLSQQPVNQRGLMLVIGWLTASLIFGLLFAFLGTRSASVIYGYDGTQRSAPADDRPITKTHTNPDGSE